MTTTDIDWPELSETRRSAVVCDGCHASLDQLATSGHHGECDEIGRHQHHASAPIESCTWYRCLAGLDYPIGPMRQPDPITSTDQNG